MLTPFFVRPFDAINAPRFHAQRTAKCTLTPPHPDQPEQPEQPQESGSKLYQPPQWTPAIPRKQSLPTYRERLYLQSLHLIRPRGRAPRYARTRNMSLMVWPLIQEPMIDSEEPLHPLPPIPSWAYIVRVRAAKSVLGKRAVHRNRAKRRVKAAAAKVMPGHARRGWEYVFAPGQGALEVKFEALVDDVEQCLRSVGAWKDEMTLEEVVRELYCDRYR